MTALPVRTVRISDHVWAAIQQRARLEGITPSRVLVVGACEYVSKPLPAVPERKQGKRTAARPGRPLDALGLDCGRHGERQAKGVCLSCGEPAEPPA